MTQRSARAFTFSLCVAALAACSSSTTPLTQIVVVVDSDLKVPDELDAVSIEVSGGGSTPTQTTNADLRTQPLPRSLGLVHSTGGLGPVRVRVRGLSGGDTVVERLAVVSFKKDATVLLRVLLERACTTALAPSCSADMTCDAGRCVAATIATLPAWNGKLTPFAGSGAAGGGGRAGDGSSTAGRGGTAVGGGGGAGKPAAGGGGGSGSGAGGGTDIVDAGMTDGPVNLPPTCAISQPTAAMSFNQGDDVMFVGTCSDPETGPLSSGLRWDSDRDGLIGVTTHVTKSDLSVGQHDISLCGADPVDSSINGCAHVSITVTATVSISAMITSLTQGATAASPYTTGSSLVATGTGTGTDPVTLTWSDSLIGTVAGTNTATMSSPLVGRHRLTLTVTDGRMRTATDTRTFVVLASGETKLLAPYGIVNQALTSAGSGKVDALAADAMNDYIAADQPAILYSFPAGDPMLGGPTPSVEVTTISTMREVQLHAGSGHAYLATSSGLQVCGYTVSGGVDSSACTTYQGGSLPSNSITTVLRLNVGGTDRLLLGTPSGLFVPDNVDQPNGTGSKPSSTSITSLAVSGQSLWVLGVDSARIVDLTASSPFSSSSSWQIIPVAGPSLSMTHVALANSDSGWISGAAGIGRYTPATGSWKLWRANASSSAPSIASDDVRHFAISHTTIANTARDVIWLGTAAGVSRLDSLLDTVTTFTTDDGLPSNSVRAVLVLPNGDKLFGTDAGLALYKGQ